ncbi:lutropin-choriogonadotropic hormone receptor [Patella vulgata]|uniref:lutropin-choriogonadotropic hormone receptor n=1 Tax=Patella vulgata TaxID=6465 RepID=UPI0021801953|nr:lutropin-choriogonadotropic hormone receptor [Patella vulgata]
MAFKVRDFENNPSLRTLGEFAFDGIQELKSLNLSKTRISYLPTVGLTSIEDLNIEHTPTLRIFPSVLQFSNIKVARLTYAHHCCAFQHPEKQDPQLWKAYEFQETVRKKCETPQTVSTSSTWVLTQSPVTEHFRIRIRRSGDQHDKWGDFGGSFRDSMGSNGFGTFPEPSTPFPRTKTTKKSTIFEIYHDNTTLSENNTEPQIVACGNISRIYSEVICTPQPNAFNPCEDVMGYEWLRVVVWFVVLAALLGNLVVILVLITGRSKMTVPKFLMCNLSVADFLMGFYLLLIASIDIHSLGEYFNHAVSWQNDGGCQIAGFLTVFASELSIYILTVLTIERWYAISYAIHLTKRLKLRQASALMVIGWCYAILMASLPLLGISGYGTVSICLPMEATDLLDRGYICSLLILNGVAFLVICCCYINMYFKVRKSDTTANSNDATIAKRMSLLVFTNFVCWAPIAFFGLTASAGFPLIDITNSKILLVFFYPLNSCANPFLYVILTKQFRKDVFILLGRYGICTARANRYKGTYSGSKTISNSRHNGMHLHNVQQAPDLSVLAHISKGIHKGSKMSLNGSSTPHSTPITTPSLTPKQSPTARVQDIEQTPNVSSGAWSGNDKNKERKLSTVPETSQGSDDFDCEATCIIEATEGLKDILDDRGSNRVRSASEYVILYPACQRENRKRLCRTSYDKRASMETSLSSATETSYLSDSSWRESAEIEKIPSAEQNTPEGDDGQAACEVVKPSPSTVQERRQNFRNSPVEQSVICQSSDEEEQDATQSLL